MTKCDKCGNDIQDWQNLVRVNTTYHAWLYHDRISYIYFHTKCYREAVSGKDIKYNGIEDFYQV